MGANLAWSTAALSRGVLSVVSTMPPSLAYSVTVAGLTVSWPPDHLGWRLLTQTNNLNLGLSPNPNDWTAVPASDQTNLLVLPVSLTQRAGFYRLVYP